MQHLTPKGLNRDGTRLVLVSESGEEFSVTVDHRLRTALRGDQPRSGTRTGQLEKKMESALRPRDIQMRIRSGESAEDVASAAGTTVEAIMPFAGPVLAERQHMAESAQKCSIRRGTGAAPVQHRTLADATAAYLSPQGIKVDDVEWDAWRRDDGRWTLVASWADETAHFTFDHRGRYVVADDEAARRLTGEAAAPVSATEPTRRLSAVRSEHEVPLGDENELGTDAIALVRERDLAVPQPEPAAEEEQTTDLSRTVEAVRAEAPAEPEPQPQPQVEREPEPAPSAENRESRPSRRKGRSSVPSWDEIMFGGGSQD